MKRLTQTIVVACLIWCAGPAGAQDLPLIDSTQKAKAAQQKAASRLGKPVTWSNTVGMQFQLIPAGRFVMGCPSGDEDAPLHTVTISKPFYIGKHEVSRAQWEKVTGTQRSDFFSGENMPINYITWYDVNAFFRKLKKTEPDNAYRLPTEAEWEYAARAGVASDYPTGDEVSDLDAAGWYLANAQYTTHPVGQKPANAFGIHDMLGNVWEWCSDFYDADYYSQSPPVDPTGPAKSLYGYRVLRGGSIYYKPRACRHGNRAYFQSSRTEKHIGFRVVLPIAEKEAAK